MRIAFWVTGWAIEDGRPEIAVGDELDVALLASAQDVRPVDGDATPGVEVREHGVLAVEGRVVAVSTRGRRHAGWLVDVGVPIFLVDAAPAWATVGVAVRGTVEAVLDHFEDAEEAFAGRRDAVPSRAWRVTRIRLDTRPWREAPRQEGRGITLERHGPPTYADLDRTDAWHDDEHGASYLLDAELADDLTAVGPPA